MQKSKDEAKCRVLDEDRSRNDLITSGALNNRMDATSPANKMLEPFVYSAIQPNEMRLLHIAPSSDFDSEVVSELRVTTLPNGDYRRRSDYTALSYAWGPSYDDGSHLTDSIICNGCRLRVTANLKQALKRIREFKNKSLVWLPPLEALWVDAICINQDDLKERSQQVARMGKIYECNKILIIWLGEPDTGKLGQQQTDMLKRTHNAWRGGGIRPFRISHVPRQCLRLMSFWPPHMLNSVASKLPLPLPHILYNPKHILMSILDRAWFSRRWVIQEAIHGPADTFILIGDTICLSKAIKSLLYMYGLLSDGNPLWRSPPYSSRRPMLNALYTYDKAECADARDRFFAIKERCHERARILVDYRKNVRNTYLDLMKTIALDISPNIEILGDTLRQQRLWSGSDDMIRMLAYASCKKTDTNDMESWIPDWTVETKFESRLHWQTVESHMDIRGIVITAYLSYSLLIAPNGYHYLNITGILLKLLSLPRAFSAIARNDHLGIDRSMRVWLKTFLKISMAQSRDQCLQNDRIWLPRAHIYVSRHEMHGYWSLAFILKPGRTGTSFRGSPIYRIHSCFRVKIPKWRTVLSLERPEPELRQSLTLAGFLFDQDFCLE